MEQRPLFGSLASAFAGGAIVLLAGGVGAALLPLVWTPPKQDKVERKVFQEAPPQALAPQEAGRLDRATLNYLLESKRDDPIAADFGAKFLAQPALRAVWDRYQQDGDFSALYQALMASQDFAAIFGPAGQDPRFRATMDPLLADPRVHAALEYAQTHAHDPPAPKPAPRTAKRFILPEMDEELLDADIAFRRKSGLASKWLLGLGILFGALAWWRRPRRAPSAPADAPPQQPAAGQPAVQPSFAEKYEVVRELAHGAAAQLVEARDKRLDRLVLVHRLVGGDIFRRRALAAAPRAAAAVSHPALLEIYEITEDGQDVCVVYERCSGKSVAQLLAQGGRMPLPRALEILEPACRALEAAHARGVFHRWLAPERILVTDQGFTKIIGLGLGQDRGGDGRADDVRALAACLRQMTGVDAGAQASGSAIAFLEQMKQHAGLSRVP